MKRVIIIHSVIILIITFIMAGCRVTGRDYPLLSTLSDVDGDGIPDVYDYPDNPTTQEIACTVNGQTVYLRCDLTEDCNCNGIHDGEERETTEKCGWGCVLGNSRTYIMIGTGLVGAYILGQYVHWPFWGKDEEEKHQDLDVEGKKIEYVEPKAINWTNSFLKYELVNEGGTDKMFMHIKVEGLCKSDEYPNGFECSLEVRNQVKSVNIRSNSDQSIQRGYVDYNFNIDKSPINGEIEQYIKVRDGRKDEQYVSDPSWLGYRIEKADSSFGVNRSYFQLDRPEDCNGRKLYTRLKIAPSEEGIATGSTDFEVHLSANFECDNFILVHTWTRANFD